MEVGMGAIVLYWEEMTNAPRQQPDHLCFQAWI
jgi:hypothetical protein